MTLKADQRRLAFEVEQRLAAYDINVILAKPLGRKIPYVPPTMR
jgi:hypothetical protein